ncbi:MAG: hypothetical protein EZS28_010670 [Streblomastix strix]|uniref:Uncharacterized protein n=1 Tax=Streblomastix strix TaxID=222440 RepID=A0A5J4WFJ9_9EUKA|nr:MAG: hypothetical protein EZS28_010670 [Streblomastix strix]
MTIELNDDIHNQGIRIMKNKANWYSFVLTGCNADPTDRGGVWKVGSTSSQFRIQKQEDEAYDYKGLIIDFDCISLKFNNEVIIYRPPVEVAAQQSIAYGNDPNTVCQSEYTMFSINNAAIKPQFTDTPRNIPINAVMFAQKVIGYPICWNGAIPIDCFINPNVTPQESGSKSI